MHMDMLQQVHENILSRINGLRIKGSSYKACCVVFDAVTEMVDRGPFKRTANLKRVTLKGEESVNGWYV